ncbi:MAG: transglycosylase SLT domain-containing protein [Bacteroidales bacterium]|nr:transglycosylase SLT domain-containing protein [Bacteroidales bacterium]
MKRSRRDETRRDPTRMRRLLRSITLSLWGAVLVGVVYYFAVVYRAPQPKTDRVETPSQTEWHDVPIAEVGAGEVYEELEQYSTLYALEYLLDDDSIWPNVEANRLKLFGLYKEEEDDDDEEEVVVPAKPVSTSETSQEQSQEQSARRQGMISEWDYLFQRYGERYGWDWYVLAAIAYQESKFRAEIVGMGGATGLMGIMPATGRRYGYSRAKLKHAESSVRIACMALRDFGRAFAHITDAEQRMKFTIASYNSGSAHVLDARRLAEDAGLDPDRWDGSVELYMVRLNEPKYYNHPLVQHGRANGDHTVRYVTEVFNRAQSYKSKVQYATAE